MSERGWLRLVPAKGRIGRESPIIQGIMIAEYY